MIEPYWRDQHDAPFATMLGVIDTYCHPEAYDEAYDDLVALAREPAPTEELVRFKGELRRVLTGDTEGLHPEALSTAAEYGDGSDEAFLRRLWRDLYPDEPIPTPADAG